MPTPSTTDSKPLMMLMASILCFGVVSAYFSIRAPSTISLLSQTNAIAVTGALPTEILEASSAPVPPSYTKQQASQGEPTAAPAPVLLPSKKKAKELVPPITPERVQRPVAEVRKATPSKPVENTIPPTARTLSKVLPSVTQAELESAMPVVRAVTALPLVPVKPLIVMATKEKAWVRLDDRKTVIVTKGDEVPGLGKLLELDAKSVKFEKGTLPVTTD